MACIDLAPVQCPKKFRVGPQRAAEDRSAAASAGLAEAGLGDDVLEAAAG
jgi:hypothetical protein